MKSASDDSVRVFRIISLATAGVFLAAVAGWKFYDEVRGFRMNDNLIVNIRGNDGQVQSLFGVKVRAIKPSGELLIAGYRRIRINDEVWTVSLSGQLRGNGIRPNAHVDSTEIVDLEICKSCSGDDELSK